MPHPLLEFAACWGLAGVFVVAVFHKLRHYHEFLGTLEQYRIMPSVLVPAAAPLVPLLEAVAALALVAPASRPFGGALAAGLLLLYSVAIGVNLYGRGVTAVDCGCGAQPTPISGWLLLRNLLLLALAPLAATPTGVADGAIYLLAGLMAIFLWLAYGALNQLLANQGQMGAAHG